MDACSTENNNNNKTKQQPIVFGPNIQSYHSFIDNTSQWWSNNKKLRQQQHLLIFFKWQNQLEIYQINDQHWPIENMSKSFNRIFSQKIEKNENFESLLFSCSDRG